jgi:fatty acid kinase fatty acid binding subunit
VPGGSAPVAVVTDSTASMPDCAMDSAGADSAGPAGAGLTIVPLRLLAGALVVADGGPGAADAIETAAAHGERLTTARPAPAQFAAAYRAAAEAGARAVLSVHVSGLLSGTVSSAALAAAEAPVPVRVLDARTIGSGLGLVVLAAVAAAQAGQDLDAVAAAAGACAEQVGSFFAVDRPDALLAGGRMPAAELAVVTAAGSGDETPRLVSRTVLRITSGRIATVGRVRTWVSAARLLVSTAAEFAAVLPSAPVVVVDHVAAAGRAGPLAARLAAEIPLAGSVPVVTSGTAIRIHTGPGMLGVSVGPVPAVG